jgi:peptide/nickel transport system ATP-binding protein
MADERAFGVEGLSVELFDETIAGYRPIVSDLNFRLTPGMGLGITGESGSGKTTLSLALGFLLPPGSRIVQKGDATLFSGGAPVPTKSRVPFSRSTFMLFQEPRASLNPHRTIGWQLGRVVRRAAQQGDKSDLAAAALTRVGLDPDVARHYPRELSTGMCQRVFLAMADLLGAATLIADEPFASVDSATQARLADLVRDWKTQRGLMLVIVSHDLDLLRTLTERTIVMYRGQVAESGPTRDVLATGRAAHPYTRLLTHISAPGAFDRELPGLHRSAAAAACCFAPRCAWADPSICTTEVPSPQTVSASDAPHELRCVRHPLPDRVAESVAGMASTECDLGSAPDLLRMRGVGKDFSVPAGFWRRRVRTVLDNVTLTVRGGERLGIMGPSGQGKTTLARILTAVTAPSRGRVEVAAGDRWLDATRLRPGERAWFRRTVQMVYQDADLVLDPASRIGESIVEAYRVFDPRLAADECYRLSAELLDELALPQSVLEAYPYRLSGGERKRVVLARTLAAFGCPHPARPGDPWRLVILDEPTAGVDVVLQAVLARFLSWAQSRLRLSYLVISHDESFVRGFCHRALRLENGHVVS